MSMRDRAIEAATTRTGSIEYIVDAVAEVLGVRFGPDGEPDWPVVKVIEDITEVPNMAWVEFPGRYGLVRLPDGDGDE